uniref:NADH-ubiquinone oxidoreductase chain 2 n=1 Tax=Viana regina TaxID=1882667 RepID=A0A1B2G3G4_9GAST|nr:NADH dehydrogenase subunit 2 [Viana regina]
MYGGLKLYGLVSFFFMVFGVFFSLSAVSWLWVWVGMELNLIGFIPFLFLNKGVSVSEGAMKYIIVQSIGSSLILFGSFIDLGHSSLWVIDVNICLFEKIIGLFLAFAFGIKLGLFPFYHWLPSVASSCSMGGCVLLLTLQKIGPFNFFFVIYDFGFVNNFGFVFVIYLMCIGSSLVGGFGGLNSTHFRKIMAYSSINHSGWIVFSIGFSVSVSWVYMFIYFFSIIVIFFPFIFGFLCDLRGLSLVKGSVYSYLFVLIQLLSLGGLPPLLGFYGKLMVIVCSFCYTDGWVWVLFLIFGSLLSLCYYLSLVFIFFMNLMSFKSWFLIKVDFGNKFLWSFYFIVLFVTLSPVFYIYAMNLFYQS